MVAAEWHVERVPDPGRRGPLPAGGVPGVKALPAAVTRIGLLPGDPVFVAPDFKVDLDLLDFVRSKDFRSLERETKQIGLAGSHVPHDRTHSRKAQETDKARRPIVPAARAAFPWQRYRHCPQRRYPDERLVQPLRIRISRLPRRPGRDRPPHRDRRRRGRAARGTAPRGPSSARRSRRTQSTRHWPPTATRGAGWSRPRKQRNWSSARYAAKHSSCRARAPWRLAGDSLRAAGRSPPRGAARPAAGPVGPPGRTRPVISAARWHSSTASAACRQSIG